MAQKRKPSSAARARALEAQRRAAATCRKLVAAAAVVVLLGIVLIAVMAGTGSKKDAVIAGPKGTRHYDVASRNHVTTPVHYAQNPPVGGDHSPFWQDCGFYEQPIVTEQGVHSLEHGAVWITYSPTLAAAQVKILRNLAAQPYVLVSPYKGLPSPVVASAWGYQLQLRSASDPRLAQFLEVYRGGPQAPERGAACVGGAS